MTHVLFGVACIVATVWVLWDVFSANESNLKTPPMGQRVLQRGLCGLLL